MKYVLLMCALTASALATCNTSTLVTTPDQASVQACVNASVVGQTVTLSAGSATYSSTVTVNKGITIAVALGATVTLTSSSATSPAFFSIVNTGSNFARITGDNGAGPDNCKLNGTTCGLILNRQNDATFFSSAIYMQGPVLSVRIDHVKGNKGDSFLYYNNSSSATGPVYGVVDHSYLINYGRSHFANDQRSTDGTFGLGCPGGTNGETSWHEFLGHQMTYAGTGNLLYFEDVHFDWTSAPASPGQGSFYSQYGGKVAVRYSTLDGWSPHITDEADAPACGSVYYEVYNNTITENCTLTGFGCEGKVFDIRSGNGLYHDNTFVSSSIPATLIRYNDSTPHVVGHDPNNIYWWNNTWNSGSGAQPCQSDAGNTNPTCVDVDSASQAPVPHRIIGAASSCANNACFYLRPPTTAGDVFFGYTPYPYPHPLIAGTPGRVQGVVTMSGSAVMQ